MKKSHYYPILLLLGSLRTAPLYAVHCEKPSAQQPPLIRRTFYAHGDKTFFSLEKDQIDPKELTQRLIHLAQSAKAKDKRKVYFFVGATGAGKSLSIQTLQGNTIQTAKEATSHSPASAISHMLHPTKKSTSTTKFSIKHVTAKKQVPLVGVNHKAWPKSTYIYYPNPKESQYKDIAFADTEGLFGIRKATSAEKCASAISFFYAAKANNIGGLVLTISASSLHPNSQKGFKSIAHILQTYFAKAVGHKTLQQSILLMITKVAQKEDRLEVLKKIRQLIQRCYQDYYAETYHKPFYDLNAIKKQDENRYVKFFCEMLLKQDVPKDKIDDVNNFRLNKDKFCFIFPGDKQCVQKILDKRLKKLHSIAASALCPFDNPLSQYIEAHIRDISIQLNQAIQPLLALKEMIDSLGKQLERSSSQKEMISKPVQALEARIHAWRNSPSETSKDNTLEAVFKQSHYENLPVGWEMINRELDQWKGYKLCKAFRYEGRAPIYKISATYGPKAALRATYPFRSFGEGAIDTFGFIEKHFKITTKENSAGIVTWTAVANNGIGIKKDAWLLYHATTGMYSARCDITFYALKRARIAHKKRIIGDAAYIKALVDQIAAYRTAKGDSTLENAHSRLTEKWKAQRAVQFKKWATTVHMLLFFANQILQKGSNKALIKQHLVNFNEAIQLKSFKCKPLNNKAHPKETNTSPPHTPFYQPGASQDQLNHYQPADNKVIDID